MSYSQTLNVNSLPIDVRNNSATQKYAPLLEQSPLQLPLQDVVHRRQEMNAVFKAPDKSRKEAIFDKITLLGTLVNITAGTVLFLTPLIIQKLPSLKLLSEGYTNKQVKIALKEYTDYFHKLLLQDLNPQQLKIALKEYSQVWGTKHYILINTCLKTIGFSGVLLNLQDMQSSINAKQPSMFLEALLGTVFSVLMMKNTSPLVRSLALISTSVYHMGNRNDIDNSNHPAYRREWDLKRINLFVSHQNRKASPQKHSLKDEAGSMARFIGEDIRLSFSKAPWQQLWAERKKKQKDITMPRPYQEALAAQFYLLAALGAIMNNLSSLSLRSSLKATLLWIEKFSILTAGIFASIPVFARAWQHRQDADGKLGTIGVPLQIIGRLFQTVKITNPLAPMRGLLPIGAPLTSKGVNLNTRERLAFVNILKRMFISSINNPRLRAVDILDSLQQNTKLQKTLQKQLGSPGLTYLISLLKNIAAKQQTSFQPLAQYIKPMIISYQ